MGFPVAKNRRAGQAYFRTFAATNTLVLIHDDCYAFETMKGIFSLRRKITIIVKIRATTGTAETNRGEGPVLRYIPNRVVRRYVPNERNKTRFDRLMQMRDRLFNRGMVRYRCILFSCGQSDMDASYI